MKVNFASTCEHILLARAQLYIYISMMIDESDVNTVVLYIKNDPNVTENIIFYS